MAHLGTPHVFFTLLRRSLAPAVVDRDVRSMYGPSVAALGLLAATVLHSAAIDVVVSSDGHVEQVTQVTQVTQGLADDENSVMTLWDING